MTRQAYRTTRTSRARAQFRELQNTSAYRYRIGARRRHVDLSSWLFLGMLGVIVLVACIGVGLFVAAGVRLVVVGLGL